ncbi:hypothetical protein NDU88_008987 [Pleurodeles waltl]|uniref:Uncharacterized protein n=1 Tax=Pleurodeles waltl TaxID=8319 RepID=A0AAV7QSC0_PLEWA|nr:hypothetical protein NDU88_008987 [Pleurodeles waltl]
MPARGSKAVPAVAGATTRQDRARGSGGCAGECKTARASTHMAVKQKKSAGNIADTGRTLESNKNILNGDFLAEPQDGGMHKEPLKAVNSGLTPARINMPMEEMAEVVYEEGRKSEASNDSAPRDTFAQAGTQVLTQALDHELSLVNMGGKLQKG